MSAQLANPCCAVYAHPDCAAHDPGPGHPEAIGRLASALRALPESAFARLEAPLGTPAQILRAHTSAHLDTIRAAPPGPLDAGDTVISTGSYQAALRAVGAACAAVERALSGAGPAFCATRPPGHHATRDRAMGFCLFNTAAIAALHALAQPGVARVAIVDFDVHHGNGTQDILWNEPRAAYISTHQAPFYPGTGAESERGAHGQVTNIPLPAGTGSAAYRAAFTARALPALAAARADLVIVSAGFDAHARDPLGGFALETGDFAWIAGQIAAAAPPGRVVATLEGGYDLPALADSVGAYVSAMAAA